MKIKALLVFTFLICFSCNDERQKLKKELKDFQSKKINIEYPLKSFSALNDWKYFTPKKKYQIVTYIDGTCPICLNKLGLWDEYVKNHSEKLDFLLFVKYDNIEDLKYFLQRIDYKFEVIPDSCNTFFKKNLFQQNEQFHTFLMDSSKNVLIVGNPVHINAIDKLMWQYIDE